MAPDICSEDKPDLLPSPLEKVASELIPGLETPQDSAAQGKRVNMLLTRQ
jgi:hypothetical protein